jgi:hypothetical protein
VKYRVFLGPGLFIAATLPPAAAQLEANMVWHVLLQLPMLVLAGWLVARGLPARLFTAIDRYNEYGIPGILIVIFVGLCWMIPRVLDAALQSPMVALAKYVSIPLLVGAPLALSWPRMPAIARAFVCIELLAMLLRLGWLYLAAPTRLCSNYSLADQILLGKLLLIIAATLTVYWVVRLFAPLPKTMGSNRGFS